ncbi:MAG TPA: class I SAM-dependent methyltransferase [Candidatus Udaeobacter sp.]|jgi:2-polyprenyl-3-methyl-5-hydroxy-6-metoxy-1,4-benzoquinol methylase|nr:class I SAM-dependent methyltransferase [Candidatus Udaeobacter sp.]
MRNIIETMVKWTFARRKINRKKSRKRVLKSPLYQAALATERALWKVKLAQHPESFWYPYPTLRNLKPIDELLTVNGFNLLGLCRGVHGKVADIGAADGDLTFFLEQNGFSVDAIDFELTNFNRMQGIRILKEALNSSVTIQSIDLDSQFSLPSANYDTVFLLGILYHLKNPFFVLENLARIARRCFLGTRVAKKASDGQSLAAYPVAYLLGPEECNNDSTNFWIFSSEGLKRLINRTGWNILAYTTIGDTINSTPADPAHDERAFCILESKHVCSGIIPSC